MRLLNYNDFLTEGVRQEGDKIVLDFKDNREGDIMSLAFASGRTRTLKKGNTSYKYYYAYEIPEGRYKPDDAKEFVHKLKIMDDTLDPTDLQLLVNKAVMGVNKDYDLSTFDSIIYPKSSSKVLEIFANQLAMKSGTATLVPDSFVKASRENIKFDWEKIENIKKEDTKVAVIKVTQKIKNSEGEFKMKEIFAPYRKFISDFLIFNSEESRQVFNLVSGKRVVLVDDYRTSGTSLKEMMNLLFRYDPEFVLATILVKIS